MSKRFSVLCPYSLSHFYEKVTPALKEQFFFEDLAGIYSEEGLTRLFAVCIRYVEIDGLRVLPKGKYLCASCTEAHREQTLRELVRMAQVQYGAEPMFTVQLIVVSGILQWNYEVQVYVGPTAASPEQAAPETGAAPSGR